MTDRGSRPLAPGSRRPRRSRDDPPPDEAAPIGDVADFLSTQYPEGSWTAVKDAPAAPAAPASPATPGGTIPERVERLERATTGAAGSLLAQLEGQMERVQSDLAGRLAQMQTEMTEAVARIEQEVTSRLERIEERLTGSIGALAEAMATAGPRMEELDKHLAITVRQAHDLRRLLEEERGEGLLVMEVEKAVVELREEVVTRLDRLAGDLGLEFRIRAAGATPRQERPRRPDAGGDEGVEDGLMFPEVEDPAATAHASMPGGEAGAGGLGAGPDPKATP